MWIFIIKIIIYLSFEIANLEKPFVLEVFQALCNSEDCEGLGEIPKNRSELIEFITGE